jgi:hypothetical protein
MKREKARRDRRVKREAPYVEMGNPMAFVYIDDERVIRDIHELCPEAVIVLVTQDGRKQ